VGGGGVGEEGDGCRGGVRGGRGLRAIKWEWGWGGRGLRGGKIYGGDWGHEGGGGRGERRGK